jgi:hypothetical protein
MKIFAYMFLAALLGIVAVQVQPVLAREPHQSFKLVGSWAKTLNSTDPNGNPCPFVPDTMEFFMDRSMNSSDYGSRRLPFKTSLTRLERHMTEERNPDLKGKNLVLILPDPSYTWVYTPMAYGYSVEGNELTLILNGWSPAKFTRVPK